MFSVTDVGGQHCPCPVRVSFLSGFSRKSCPLSVRCLDSVRILSVSILSAVRVLSGFLEKTLSAVCPAGQGQDRAVRTFAVLVR